MAGRGKRQELEGLRRRVLNALEEQGFELTPGGRLRPPSDDKATLRRLHSRAREVRLAKAKEGLIRHQERLLSHFASGEEIEPDHIRPRLVEVQAKTEEELLFRYARLHWSIPVSAGYGRRLRFLVMDEHNDKLIGLIGLGDPIPALASRDGWVGWDSAARMARLRHVMDAFVLGAVPPYSSLLCGKLVAMLAASNEVRAAFRRKYSRGETRISNRSGDGRLALITTASALGRSSIYNRLKFRDQPLFVSAGFTAGSGDFHLSDGVYADLLSKAGAIRSPSAKHALWGSGWRSRREVLRLVLPKLGLPQDLLYHGIRREVFIVPLAHNAQAFLKGEHTRLRQFDLPAEELFAFFRERWLLPRAARRMDYLEWNPATLRLWAGRDG